MTTELARAYPKRSGTAFATGHSSSFVESLFYIQPNFAIWPAGVLTSAADRRAFVSDDGA
jgi:hypothetical protein